MKNLMKIATIVTILGGAGQVAATTVVTPANYIQLAITNTTLNNLASVPNPGFPNALIQGLENVIVHAKVDGLNQEEVDEILSITGKKDAQEAIDHLELIKINLAKLTNGDLNRETFKQEIMDAVTQIETIADAYNFRDFNKVPLMKTLTGSDHNALKNNDNEEVKITMNLKPIVVNELNGLATKLGELVQQSVKISELGQTSISNTTLTQEQLNIIALIGDIASGEGNTPDEAKKDAINKLEAIWKNLSEDAKKLCTSKDQEIIGYIAKLAAVKDITLLNDTAKHYKKGGGLDSNTANMKELSNYVGVYTQGEEDEYIGAILKVLKTPATSLLLLKNSIANPAIAKTVAANEKQSIDSILQLLTAAGYKSSLTNSSTNKGIEPIKGSKTALTSAKVDFGTQASVLAMIKPDGLTPGTAFNNTEWQIIQERVQGYAHIVDNRYGKKDTTVQIGKIDIN